jgi:hypothetical protein
MNKSSNNVIRYYVGSTAARRGGWWVRAIVRIAGNEENGNFAQRDISTKKEAKALCARLNEELANLPADLVVIDISEVEVCAWFAYCENPATGVTPHPVLGDVPTCDRCHKFATGQDRVVVPPFATENNQPTAASIANAAAEVETFKREEIAKGPRSWAPEVIADNSGKWAGNALRFATKAEAEANVQNLFSRWTLVRETRVVESDDEPNYRWVPGTGLVAIENLCPLCGERRSGCRTAPRSEICSSGEQANAAKSVKSQSDLSKDKVQFQKMTIMNSKANQDRLIKR